MLSRVQKWLRRAVLGHRRLLAFVLTVLAVLAGVRALAPPSSAGATVLVAAHDLAAGSTLTRGDLEAQHVPPGAVPDGVVRRPEGRVLAGGVRRGEPITDVRLVGRSMATPGLTAVPIRLPDTAMAALLEPGERIDLYATDPSAGGTTSVAREVLVLAVPPRDDARNSVTSSLGGRLVVVAVPPDAVTDVTDASVRLFLTVAFRH